MGNIISYQEAHGAIATFETDVAEKIKKLVVDIKPVQDLHGYDSPWPAGSGKNLTDYSTPHVAPVDTTATVNVFTLELTAGETYTYSCLQSASLASSIRNTIAVKPSSGSTIYENAGANFNPTNLRHVLTFTPFSDGVYTFMYWGHTLSASITLTQWQVEKSSSFTSYAPYSNICPIAGWTGSEITRCGKNLLPDQMVQDTKMRVRLGETNVGNGNFVKAGTYSISYAFKNGQTAQTPYWRIYKNGENGPVNNSWKIVLSEDCNVKIWLYNSNGVAVENVDWFQLELGSIATDYEPYQGNTYDITFPSEAGTVYGGTLDLTKGKLVVDRAMVDMGTLTWIRRGNPYSDLSDTYIFTATVSRDNPPKDAFSGITSAYKWVKRYMYMSNDKTAGYIYNTSICVRDDDYTDAAAFKTAVSGAQLVYELATPITYNLTPQEVRPTIGTNTIYADTGDTLVIYPKTITPVETVSNVNLMELRRNIIAAQANDNLYDKWVWKQEKNDFVVRNNTTGFLEGLGNNIYADQRSDRENNRRSIVAKRGSVSFVTYDSVSGGTYTPVKLYPIPIPPNANNVRISYDNDTQGLVAGAMVLRLENGVYRQIKTNTYFLGLLRPLWLVTGNKHYLAPYIKRSDGGDFIGELENIQFTFSHDGQWRWTLTDSDFIIVKRNTRWKSAISKMCYNSDSDVDNYLTIVVKDGFCGYWYYDETQLNNEAPIPVPPTATKVTVTTTPALQARLMLVKALDNQTQEFVIDNDFKSTPVTMTFNADDNLELVVSLRVNSSASSFTTSTTPTEIIIQFE